MLKAVAGRKGGRQRAEQGRMDGAASRGVDGHTDVVKALLDANAQVDAQGPDGRTALMVAAENGHTGVVKALLDANAPVDAQDELGRRALDYAAWNGHTDVVELLEKRTTIKPRSWIMRNVRPLY